MTNAILNKTAAASGRVFNFSAGPAALPTTVLNGVKDELTNYRGSGMSVMEMSHRSAEFKDVAERAEQSIRRLLSIPDDYAVLFLQGGATGQFSFVPMNLAAPGDTAGYVVTGTWSKKAIKEAGQYVNTHVVADAADSNYCSIPSADSWSLPAGMRYVHYAANETIGGVEFSGVPDTGDTPLVCDMSSTILSRPVDVSRFGVIYAGAQKNVGPAGLTIVIARRDLIGNARPGTPMVFDYKKQADAGSMLNTPPTFTWYVAGKVFEWLEESGGIAAMAEQNAAKAKALYDYIDGSGFYRNPVEPSCRSWMNVPFVQSNAELDADFLREAGEAGLKNLKGHRTVGGMRASIYNAMPRAGVDALIDFMRDFAERNG